MNQVLDCEHGRLLLTEGTSAGAAMGRAPVLTEEALHATGTRDQTKMEQAAARRPVWAGPRGARGTAAAGIPRPGVAVDWIPVRMERSQPSCVVVAPGSHPPLCAAPSPGRVPGFTAVGR